MMSYRFSACLLRSAPYLRVLLLVCLAAVLSGCSGSQKETDMKARSRYIARVTQAMTTGARLGSLTVVDAQYTEREPNPNAYVGKQVYRRYCESCHGSIRKAPDIMENRVTVSDSESDYYIILYGLNEMPAFRNRLTKFQIYDVLKYMNPEFTGLKNKAEKASQ